MSAPTPAKTLAELLGQPSAAATLCGQPVYRDGTRSTVLGFQSAYPVDEAKWGPSCSGERCLEIAFGISLLLRFLSCVHLASALIMTAVATLRLPLSIPHRHDHRLVNSPQPHHTCAVAAQTGCLATTPLFTHPSLHLLHTRGSGRDRTLLPWSSKKRDPTLPAADIRRKALSDLFAPPKQARAGMLSLFSHLQQKAVDKVMASPSKKSQATSDFAHNACSS
eukprot:gene4056-biopygen676